MEYSKEFYELVELLKQTKDESLKFIGTGNPSAKILIIGQEVALNKSDSDFDFHYGLHQENAKLWSECIRQQQDYDDIEIWGRDCKNYVKEDFSPLYPYKGDQKIHKSLKNGGTSKTWLSYQKLLSFIYPNVLSDTEVDFHKYSFISEMSSIPFPKSPAKNKETAESIKIRTENLFTQDFFRQFTVIIVASGNYVAERMYGIDLQTIFNQEYVEIELSEKTRSEWINIHKSNGRLLLHCRQLSFCSDDILHRLADRIRQHLKL